MVHPLKSGLIFKYPYRGWRDGAAVKRALAEDWVLALSNFIIAAQNSTCKVSNCLFWYLHAPENM